MAERNLSVAPLSGVTRFVRPWTWLVPRSLHVRVIVPSVPMIHIDPLLIECESPVSMFSTDVIRGRPGMASPEAEFGKWTLSLPERYVAH